MATFKGTKRGETLTGTSGADTINAMGGADTLIGGGGADKLTGGSGADTFKYLALSDSVAATGIDRITDFSAAAGDKVDLSELGTATLQSSHNASFAGLQAVFAYDAGTNTTTLSYYQGSNTPVFQVRFAGNVSYSETAFLGIVNPPPPPPPPQDTTAPVLSGETDVGGDHDTISFTVNTDEAGTLKVYDGTTLVKTVTVNAGANPIEIDGLTPNTAYTFTYTVTDAANNVSNTETVSLTTAKSPTPTTGDDLINGTAGNDTINALAGDDIVNGLAGDDTLIFSAGSDTFDGGDGTDTIDFSGVDGTYGGIGTDGSALVYGETLASADRVTFSNVEKIIGSAFADTINLSTLTTHIRVEAGAGNDQITGGAGLDALFGGDGDDYIAGGGANDSLYGNAGDDSVAGGEGNDFVAGGDGTDTAVFTGARADYSISINTEAGDGSVLITDNRDGSPDGTDIIWTDIENVQFSDGTMTLDDALVPPDTTAPVLADETSVGGDHDTVSFTVNTDEAGTLKVYYGGTTTLLYTVAVVAGANVITIDGLTPNTAYTLDYSVRDAAGNVSNVETVARTTAKSPVPTAGDDDITGTAGNDTINALAGNDVVNGLGGSDTLIASPGDDTFDGGLGYDTIDYRGVDVTAGGIDTLAPVGDYLVLGQTSGDTVSFKNVERIFGSSGNDTFNFGTLTTSITIFGEQGHDQITGGSVQDSLSGGSGNDTISGGDGYDSLDGGDGDDTLNGGAGNDYISGGAGTDTLVLSGASTDYTFGGNWNYLSITDTRSLSPDGTDYITAGMEFIQFSDMTLTLSSMTFTRDGTADVDYLNGTPYNDVLNGFAGNDYLQGGDGNDTLNGGAGTDNLYGGAGDDTLNAGDAGTDYIDGGIGTDTSVVSGLPDDYTLSVDRYGYDVYLTAKDGSVSYRINLVEQVKYGDGSTISLGPITINGTDRDDSLYGTYLDDVIYGLGGNDQLYGGSPYGNDVFDGGDGVDWAMINFSGAQSGVTFATNNSTDLTVETPNGTKRYINIESFIINGSDHNDVLTGGDHTDSLNGYAGNDILNGSGGDDFFSDHSGDDTYNGGAGVDTAYLNFHSYNSSAGVSFTAGDQTVATASGTKTLTSIERFQIFGTNSADNLTGASDNDYVSGSGGNDSISGLSGKDHLNGGDGDDTISGGAGDDKIEGGSGSDTLVLSGNRADYTFGVAAGYYYNDGFTVTDNRVGGLDGVDEFSSIEFIQFGNGEIVALTDLQPFLITGNDIDTTDQNNSRDYLVGSFANDLIKGLRGNDYLIGNAGSDILVGGLGADYLDGGAGADTFVYETINDAFSASYGEESIRAFETGVDKIDLSAIDANPDLAEDQAFIFAGSAHNGDSTVAQVTFADYLMKVYMPGDDVADMVIRVYGTAPTAVDFIL